MYERTVRCVELKIVFFWQTGIPASPKHDNTARPCFERFSLVNLLYKWESQQSPLEGLRALGREKRAVSSVEASRFLQAAPGVYISSPEFYAHRDCHDSSGEGQHSALHPSGDGTDVTGIFVVWRLWAFKEMLRNWLQLGSFDVVHNIAWNRQTPLVKKTTSNSWTSKNKTACVCSPFEGQLCKPWSCLKG